jgi:hypothetical protein
VPIAKKKFIVIDSYRLRQIGEGYENLILSDFLNLNDPSVLVAKKNT